MCIRDRYQRRVHGDNQLIKIMRQKVKHLLIVFGTAALVALALALAYVSTDARTHFMAESQAFGHKQEVKKQRIARKHKQLEGEEDDEDLDIDLEDYEDIDADKVGDNLGTTCKNGVTCTRKKVTRTKCTTEYVTEKKCDKKTVPAHKKSLRGQ
eukprot:TRINITY_DN30_c0_g1_i5.p3 TRINITY_DN30_c0_g1~~TRINITY_DN30_c0_g1_i5.p3  ORF type:complete len:154 (+),score=60.01 TRINITY_DN30_c0_g1_i5:65-526(+)